MEEGLIMKKIIKIICCFAILLCIGCSPKSHLDPDHPVTIELWNYYSGKQLESFNKLVKQFNTTIGKEKGIIVEVTGFGNVDELGQSVIDAANKKIGAKEVPHIFAAYLDNAYQVDQLGLVQDLNPYFTKEELNEYVDGYIEEGIFNDELKIFPIAKSTEIMMINMTDFEKFSKATGAQIEDLSTIEGVSETAKKYYEYTDSLTPALHDGKAMFGRDAIANYIIIGLKQLGHDIISIKDGKAVLDFDKDVVKKLWDHYYTPYIHGYFSSEGRFRSDDVKLGNIICFVGSSSAATFFPSQVIINNEENYPINAKVLEAPLFKDAKNYAVQQGAGMVVTKSDDAHQEGSVEFLKWFTKQEQNVSFSIESGYLPVKKEANQMDNIESQTKIATTLMKDVIKISVDTVNHKELYTTKAFSNATPLRTLLESCLKDQAVHDRQTIEEALAKGQNEKDIYSKYDSQDYFEQWYQDTYQKLKSVVEKS